MSIERKNVVNFLFACCGLLFFFFFYFLFWERYSLLGVLFDVQFIESASCTL